MKTKLMALEALKKTLQAGHGLSTDFAKQGIGYDAAIEAIAALEADIAKGVAPVGAESKFVSSREWSRCTIEHHEMVQRTPNEWSGYETRLLYTTPQEPAAAELLEALKRIESWNEHSAEFSMDYGSNGVRDFYRGIARVAISKASWSAS